MKSVCFVCYGNTHRSPFFRYAVEYELQRLEIPQVNIDIKSAGLYSTHGYMSDTTWFYLREFYNIAVDVYSTFTTHSLEEVGESDLVLVMEPWMVKHLQNRRCFTIIEYLTGSSLISRLIPKIESVGDPIGLSIDRARDAYSEMAKLAQLVAVTIAMEILRGVKK